MMAGALLAALADVHAAAAAVLMHALPTEPEAMGRGTRIDGGAAGARGEQKRGGLGERRRRLRAGGGARVLAHAGIRGVLVLL